MIYDVILLDADETLFDFRRAEHHAIRATCAAYDLPSDDVVCARYSAINQSLWKLFEQGGITQARLRLERFERLLAELDATVDADTFNRLYSEKLGEGYFLLDGALELCEKLSEYYPLYIVTNGVAEVQKRRLTGSAIAPYITQMFISQELGAQKPQKEFFDAVFAALGNPARERVVLLGDSLTSDMAGAKNAGIAGCWFAPHDAQANEHLYTHRIASLSEFLPLCLG